MAVNYQWALTNKFVLKLQLIKFQQEKGNGQIDLFFDIRYQIVYKGKKAKNLLENCS